MRDSTDEEIISRVLKAYAENPELTLKILFFSRDIRGGLGERRFFRVALGYLAAENPDAVRKNIEYIPEFGRYDDLLVLLGTPCENDAFALIKKQWSEDVNSLRTENKPVSLLGKWLPSVNTSNIQAVKTGRKLAAALGLSEREYRKTLVALRARIKIIENNLRERNYTFDYEKLPSRALFKYSEAFLRNDKERYEDFLRRVSEGKAVMNTSTLTPYDIVNKCIYAQNPAKETRKTLDVSWNALPEYKFEGNTLAVVDGSGSMYCMIKPMPISVAISLGIYFAEHTTGEYGNSFITFSRTPKFVEIKGKDIYEKVKYCMEFNDIENTDLAAVFELVLKAAIKNNLPQSELPARIVIISDMEFDDCIENAEETNFEHAKKLFEAHGYKLPTLVFWNVAARGNNFPVTQDERGVTLVSGFTPSMFEMVSAGEYLTPYEFMTVTLANERYSKITA